jgi:hypothetical protein
MSPLQRGQHQKPVSMFFDERPDFSKQENLVMALYGMF